MESSAAYTIAHLCRDAARTDLHPDEATMGGWRQMAARYPYFTLPVLMELKHTPADAPQYKALAARVALSAADIDTLLSLVDSDAASLSHLYPPQQEPLTPSTTEALDTFLNTYGQADNLPDETRLLEKIIFNPVPADYALTLAGDDEDATPSAPADEQDSLLDAFLASQGAAAAPVKPVEAPAPTSRPAARADDPLSESLAMIYIRQGRYEKAYEIIHQLSLNFPKKSIYFADQLRFLRKLMLNAERGK